MLSFKEPPIFGIDILSTAAATVSLKQKTKDDNMLHIEICQNIFCGISNSRYCVPVSSVSQSVVYLISSMSPLSVLCLDQCVLINRVTQSAVYFRQRCPDQQCTTVRGVSRSAVCSPTNDIYVRHQCILVSGVSFSVVVYLNIPQSVVFSSQHCTISSDV